jgi:hypothetical protein
MGASLTFQDLQLSADTAAELNLVADKTQIAISRLKIPGPDLSADITGNARLNRQNQITRYTMDGTVAFGEKFSKQFPMVGLLDKQKNPDGTLSLSVKGSSRAPVLKIGEIEIPLSGQGVEKSDEAAAEEPVSPQPVSPQSPETRTLPSTPPETPSGARE